jgi:rod shape-determining protein MreD
MLERLLILLGSRWARLVLVVLFVLSLQTTLFNEVRPFGFVVHIVAIFVACSGVTYGLQIGAITGLVAGFMYDAVLAPPLGVSALVLGAVGATAALFLRPFRDPPWWLRVVAASAAAGLAEVYTPIMKSVIGLDGWFSVRVFGAVAVTFVAALIVSMAALPVSRWTLRPEVTFGG